MRDSRLRDSEITYLYVEIAEHIECLIDEMRHGQRLPGEERMAQQFDVSIGTIRRAIKLLTRHGRVCTLPGKGTYVIYPDAPDGDRGRRTP